MSDKILVTGGAGFAGAYTVRKLLGEGHDVVVYDVAGFRNESKYVLGDALESVELRTGSIDNWPRLLKVVQETRPDAIVHLGSIMDTYFLDQNPMIAVNVNVAGTCNVFEAVRAFDVGRTVIFSTIAVHGKLIYEPIDGDHPTVTGTAGPLGAYSAAKLSCEAFGYAYQQSFGLDVRIIRPSALYGFGMSWFAPNYVKQIVEPAVHGDTVSLHGGGSVPRDYTNVVDVAGLVAALLRGPDDADRIFYAASGQPLQTGSDVGRIVSELIPGSEITVGDEMTDVDRAELAFRGQISIDNARTQLGFQPQFADLRTGLADYIQRYRDFLDGGGAPTPRPPSLTNAPGA